MLNRIQPQLFIGDEVDLSMKNWMNQRILFQRIAFRRRVNAKMSERIIESQW